MNPLDYRQTANSLDFFAVGRSGLERCKTRLTRITHFGLEHTPVFTAEGTFTRWERWGYLQTKGRRYRVSHRLVRRWQAAWRWQLTCKTIRVGIRGEGLGKVMRVVDWEWRVEAHQRRGGAWPRCRRRNLPPETVLTLPVLRVTPGEVFA